MFALEKSFFINDAYECHWTCEFIFMEENIIQYYYSMGINGHVYTTGLMIYLKDEQVVKNGGELPYTEKQNIFSAVDSLPQQQNGFDCCVFECIFVDFISHVRPISFSQDDITNQ